MLKQRMSLFLALLAGVVLSSCTSVKYEGPNFSPTTRVKVFYDKSEIKRPYKVMGKAVASTWYSYQNTSLRPALIEKAKTCGADAIYIEEIDSKISAPVRTGADSTEIEYGGMANDNPGSGTDNVTTLPGEEGEATTESIDTSRIVAEFLKYTDK